MSVGPTQAVPIPAVLVSTAMAAHSGPIKPRAVEASPNILSMGERIPKDLPRKVVWVGDRMHFKVTEFK